MLAVTFGTIRRLPLGSGELQLMPVMTAGRVADKAGRVGGRAERTIRWQEAKGRRERLRMAEAALGVERRVRRRERTGLVRRAISWQEGTRYQQERHDRRRQGRPHFRLPQRPRPAV